MATPHDATAHVTAALPAHTEDHDHDGTPTQKLLAANSHESPATDTHHAKNHGDAEHPVMGRMILIRKPADETITLSLTLQDDDDLFFSVAANEAWAFHMGLVINSTTAGDFRMNMSAPAGAAGWFASPSITAMGTFGGADLTQATTGVDIARIFSGLIENGGTAGQVKLQWAQQTVDAGNCIVRENSFLIAHRIA